MIYYPQDLAHLLQALPNLYLNYRLQYRKKYQHCAEEISTPIRRGGAAALSEATCVALVLTNSSSNYNGRKEKPQSGHHV